MGSAPGYAGPWLAPGWPQWKFGTLPTPAGWWLVEPAELERACRSGRYHGGPWGCAAWDSDAAIEAMRATGAEDARARLERHKEQEADDAM